MTDRNIIIHIGMSKCASTFLQKKVFPRLGNYSNVAFAPIHEKYLVFQTDMNPDAYRGIVSRHMQNTDANKPWTIVSCEDYAELLFRGFTEAFYAGINLDRGMYHFSNEVIATNLARAFPGAKIMIIIREQISWAISRYKMNYRGGKTSASIDEMLMEPQQGYDDLIRLYQNIFGKEKVLVMPYELLREDHAAFLNMITGFIGAEESIKFPDEPVNVAPELYRTVARERIKNRLRLGIKHAAWLTPPGQFIARLLAGLLAMLVNPVLLMYYGSRIFTVNPQVDTLARIRPLLAASNRNTVMLTGLDLQEYGYCLD